ncbi:MAG TPA: hypothetical protein VF516_35625 [Kofleriaceae bacterium]
MGRFTLLCLGFVIVSACGSVKDVGHLPDAPPAGDAGTDAVTRGTVRVTVLDPSNTGAPAVGANVVFLDPDGTLVKRVATDTTGKAQADVLPGASVASVALQNNAYQIQAVLAVRPGDDLILGVKNADTTSIGTFTVSFPAYTVVTPASYTVAGACGTASSFPPPAGGPPPASVTMTFNNSCKLDTMEIVVQANDGNGNPLAVLDKTGVALLLNGSTTLSGAYQSPRNFTASYTNVNSLVTSMSTTRRVPDAFGLSASASASNPTATQVLTLTGAVGSGARVETQLISGSRSIQLVRQTIAGTAASYGLDLGATLLPWLGTPTFDVASGKILLPTDTTGTTTATPDLLELLMSYQRTDPVTGITTTFSWTIFSPVAGDITLPSLPPEAGNVMPTASDAVTARAVMVESDGIANYDAIRNDLNAALATYAGNRAPGTTLRAAFSPLNLR